MAVLQTAKSAAFVNEIRLRVKEHAHCVINKPLLETINHCQYWVAPQFPPGQKYCNEKKLAP